jgi:thiol:disulfide interchange protein DsbA
MSKKKKQKLPEKKSNKTLIYAAVAVLAVVAIAAALLLSSSPAPQAPAETPEKFPSSGGYTNLSFPSTYEPGKVNITEFLKFDCPHCYDLHTKLPGILAKYGDNVTITYIPIIFPGQSTRSIEAYIIADQMGKGMEMQDALFNEAHTEILNGNVIGNNLMLMEDVPTLERVAASIGLNSSKFNHQLEGGYAKDAANANLALMTKYGVQGTPTIIINGNILVDPPTAENLDTVIGSLLS